MKNREYLQGNRHFLRGKAQHGGYLADTPGFSSIDFESYTVIKKDDVAACFPEFEPFLDGCRFPDCAHIGERDCSVKNAVESGEIPASRYESYCAFYKEAEKIRDWEVKAKR